jgi:hypothetical protein
MEKLNRPSVSYSRALVTCNINTLRIAQTHYLNTLHRLECSSWCLPTYLLEVRNLSCQVLTTTVSLGCKLTCVFFWSGVRLHSPACWWVDLESTSALADTRVIYICASFTVLYIYNSGSPCSVDDERILHARARRGIRVYIPITR